MHGATNTFSLRNTQETACGVVIQEIEPINGKTEDVDTDKQSLSGTSISVTKYFRSNEASVGGCIGPAP